MKCKCGLNLKKMNTEKAIEWLVKSYVCDECGVETTYKKQQVINVLQEKIVKTFDTLQLQRYVNDITT